MNAVPTLTVSKDFTLEFNEIIKKFKNDKVLVGIPMSNSQRDVTEGEDSGITNAQLLAMNNFGSPAMNIPARPVMQIGIKNAQDAIAEQYAKALKNVLKQGSQAIDVYYERAGIIASNSIKKAIDDQDGIAPPAASTLALRQAQGFKGTKALLRTGQMRSAISYVVKKGGV